ncbi:forkhead box protein N2 [Lepisosteus oculatus]|uniref:forkhead box protein N2 n=1 Tax=Lepisosteus oculatus TaxID=7918 RepID=UPI0003EA8E9A|nr:PREDICTED: forkhead box protein N2-like [Lepisosteus oculatus]XP_015194225.1 PREDICTED: forkhead box protein N2-like [Lepisosteus oculatus]
MEPADARLCPAPALRPLPAPAPPAAWREPGSGELGLQGCADEDLTCLSWLHQSTDLLHELRLGETQPPQSPPSPPAKPPYSFSSLIFMAIEGSPHKQLPVKEIYQWILSSFPYYRLAPAGWKNSVRHNLSLSKCFLRVGREQGRSVGKGSLWSVAPEYRSVLLEALRKTNSLNTVHTLPGLSEVTVSGETVVCGAERVEYNEPLSPSLPLSPAPVLLGDPGPWETSPVPSDPSEDHNYSIYQLATSLAGGVALQLEVGVEEELVAMEAMELGVAEKDPLADSGYIEYHEYLVLPGEPGLDLETVEILQLDQELQEAAGSLLNLAGGGYSH